MDPLKLEPLDDDEYDDTSGSVIVEERGEDQLDDGGPGDDVGGGEWAQADEREGAGGGEEGQVGVQPEPLPVLAQVKGAMHATWLFVYELFFAVHPWTWGQTVPGGPVQLLLRQEHP